MGLGSIHPTQRRVLPPPANGESIPPQPNHSATSHPPPQRAQLKNNAETYDGFLYDADTGMPLDSESFCNRYVDPIGVEAGTHRLPHPFIRIIPTYDVPPYQTTCK